jgi:carbonic anhydrase
MQDASRLHPFSMNRPDGSLVSNHAEAIAMPIQDLLEKNRIWAEGQLASDPQFFRRHVAGQNPRVLLIGCSDSRVPAEQILDCGPGELFVHRNVANVVAYNDVNLAAVLQYAIEHLKIEDIVVCGHNECGGVAAACAETLGDGYVADWLMITTWAKRWVDERIAEKGLTLDRSQYLRLVVEENVRLQVKHLGHLALVRKSWRSRPGVPRLHGWVYDIATGLIQVVVDPVQSQIDHAP